MDTSKVKFIKPPVVDEPVWKKIIVESNLPEILTDHAWCEQKAATNAISIVVSNPERVDLVTDMLDLAKEEIEHFELVHEVIKKRGYTLGRERKDSYVNELYKFMLKGGSRNDQLVDRLLFSAMIEARSCERFKTLSENIEDKELAAFYYDLMVSEAGHYTMFLRHAKAVTERVDVDKRWKEWLAHEAIVIQNYGKSETVHG